VPSVEALPLLLPLPAALPPVPSEEDEVPLPADVPPVPSVEALPLPDWPVPDELPPVPSDDDEVPFLVDVPPVPVVLLLVCASAIALVLARNTAASAPVISLRCMNSLR
jgi:hypothetical protein